jgi:hypothetical protein
MNLKKILRFRAKDAGRFVGRVRTHDVAFQYRMGAGFPGDVNRTHPASIEPTLIDSNSPPLGYGLAVVVDPTTQGVRQMAAGDSTLDAIYGITVRPFPTQQSSASNYGAIGIGSATPPTSGVMDVLRSGYIMGQLSGATQPVKGGRVYVWVAASSGGHIQGGFEAAATGGSTIQLDEKTYFNGPADASGVVEVSFNI